MLHRILMLFALLIFVGGCGDVARFGSSEAKSLNAEGVDSPGALGDEIEPIVDETPADVTDPSDPVVNDEVSDDDDSSSDDDSSDDDDKHCSCDKNEDTQNDGKICHRDIEKVPGARCDEDGSGKKVLVCHHPKGNVENRHEICISKNALKAHIDKHGDSDDKDYLGACQ